jgi:hypothetical protein
MINKKTEEFLEKTDMNYLFCLLSKLESQRLSQLPTYVRQHFPDKIAVTSMNHVADNEVPDYFAEIEEANMLMAQQNAMFSDEEVEGETGETFDDSEEHIEELAHENLDSYNDEDDDEEYDFADDDTEEEEEE